MQRWRADAVCDGHTAAARAEWLVANKGQSIAEAQHSVMREFPALFGTSHVPPADRCQWLPSAVCDGHTAGDRAQWLVQHKGVSVGEARRQVMAEFPGLFDGPRPGLGGDTSQRRDPIDPADPDRLVWSDEFDYTGPPDPTKWSYDTAEWGNSSGWGNNELQYYTDSPQNAWVSEGTLKICARRQDIAGLRYSSAKLVSKGKGDWLFGRVEVRIRLPRARGSWPAAWMLPSESSYGGWPDSGEIDIMEHVGFDSGRVHGTVHTAKYNHMKQTQVGQSVTVDVDEWHTWGIEWREQSVFFFVDDVIYHEFTRDGDGGSEAWPFDQPFYLILNVAVGGDWGGMRGVDEPQFDGDGQVMEVSWVRVYT